MKTKIILLIAITAIVTLSFSFISNKGVGPKETKHLKTEESTPVGGFAFDDEV